MPYSTYFFCSLSLQIVNTPLCTFPLCWVCLFVQTLLKLLQININKYKSLVNLLNLYHVCIKTVTWSHKRETFLSRLALSPCCAAFDDSPLFPFSLLAPFIWIHFSCILFHHFLRIECKVVKALITIITKWSSAQRKTQCITMGGRMEGLKDGRGWMWAGSSSGWG